MTIPGRLPDGPLISLRLQAALAAVEPSDPANFPPSTVQIERSGLRNTFGIGGLVVGGAGIIGAGAALVGALRGGASARLNLPTMLAFGAATIVGGTLAGGSRLIGPKSEYALAAGIPTLDLAHQVDARISGKTKIVEAADGTFAILRDNSPTYSGGGGSGSSGGSRPSGGGSRPSSGGGSSPSYPSSGGGSTSRGDDSGSSRNSTSNGNPSSDDF
ncbi:MAG: hypothetical protein JWL76_1436 [Thermoleophilia bacterium]|nr:hypothetical protein [Thermoleophilia bacterium]